MGADPGQQQLGSTPESEQGALERITKVLKKKKKKKTKMVRRGSRVAQPGGMTDKAKSAWLLEHCKVMHAFTYTCVLHIAI